MALKNRILLEMDSSLPRRPEYQAAPALTAAQNKRANSQADSRKKLCLSPSAASQEQ